jgi:molybdopterin-containing oxidoreductase family membrane subunit
MYHPTIWDWGLFTGTIGFFVFMMILFVRVAPAISIAEVKALLFESKHGNGKKQGAEEVAA